MIRTSHLKNVSKGMLKTSCWGFAVICGMLMLSTAFAGLATAKGHAGSIELVAPRNSWTATHYYWYPTYEGKCTYQRTLLVHGAIQFAFQPLSTYDFVDYLKTPCPTSLTGKKIVATMTIRQDSPDVVPQFTFGWYGQPPYYLTDAQPCSVKLEFQVPIGSAVDQTDYWWSVPEFRLSELVGNTLTLTVPMDPSLWTDIWGYPGTANPTLFAAALVNPQVIGLSFGGEYFAADGDALTAGAATFQLLSYQILPA